MLTVIGLAGHRYNFSRTYHSGSGFTSQEYADVNEVGDPLRYVRTAFLLAFTAVVFARERHSSRIRLTTTGWLLSAFFVWDAMTLVWSVDPLISTRRFLQFAIYGLAALAATRYLSPRGLAGWVLISTFAYIHMGIGVELLLGTFRPWEAEYRFAGTLHPNNQAFNCVMMAFAGLFLWRGGERNGRLRWLYGFAVLEGMAVLLLTKSRTSLGCALLALGVFALLNATPARKTAMALAGSAVACLAVMAASVLSPLLAQATTLGRPDSENATLTGRLPLWEQCIGYVAERPIGGWGFGAFWTRRHLIDVAAEQGWLVPDAHSSYVDLLLGTGVVGAVLYLGVVICAVRQAGHLYRTRGDEGFAFVGVLLIFVGLAGMSESIVFSGSHVSFVCLLAIGVMAVAQDAVLPAEHPTQAPAGARRFARSTRLYAAGVTNAGPTRG